MKSSRRTTVARVHGSKASRDSHSIRGDTVLRSADAVGIRRNSAGKFATLRWVSGDVARARSARNARRRARNARLRNPKSPLASQRRRRANAAEAQRLLDAKQRVASGEVAEWQTQPPQKRPRQLMWVRLPPSPPGGRPNSLVGMLPSRHARRAWLTNGSCPA